MEKKNIETVNEDVSLKEVVLEILKWYRFLISKWKIILVFGITGAVIGFAYARFKKPVYSAKTTFVLEEGDKSGGLGQYAGLASMIGVDLGGNAGGIFQGDNILELYKSRVMIEKTLLTAVLFNGNKILLVDRYIDFNKLRKAWAEKPELKGVNFDVNDSKFHFSRLQDSILGTIVNDINKKYLTVSKADKKTSIIEAEVKAEDEFFAKNFNEQIVKNVNDFYIQTKTKKSMESINILQQKTDSVKAVMNGAIYNAAAAADATPNLNPSRSVQRAAPLQQSQFSVETNKAMLSELLKNLELSKISFRKETPLIQVIDEPVLPLSYSKLSKLMGLIIGGIIGGFAICFFLIIRKVLNGLIV